MIPAPKDTPAHDDAERALRAVARETAAPPRASLADRVLARLATEPPPARRRARIVPIVLAAAAALLIVAALATLLAPDAKTDEVAQVDSPRPEPLSATVADVRPMLLASATEALAEPIATYRAPIDWLSGPVARQAAGAIELLAQAGAAAVPEPTPREAS